MSEMNILTLDNNKKYYQVGDLVVDNVKYLLLAKVDNIKDISIRKVLVKDGVEVLAYLDSDSEFDKVFNLFNEKNKVLFD